jgi:hypothetical protein
VGRYIEGLRGIGTDGDKMSAETPPPQWWTNGFEEYDSIKATKMQILMLQGRMHILEKLLSDDERVVLKLAGPGIFLPGMSKRRASELIGQIKGLVDGRNSAVKKLSGNEVEDAVMLGNVCPSCSGEVSVVGSLNVCNKCGAAYLKMHINANSTNGRYDPTA